jgi:nucleoside 2-deoxyribosyltransferase
MNIYLAGPEVFLPEARALGAAKQEVCARFGVTGLFPLDNELGPRSDPAEQALEIYRGNRTLMDRAHAIVANMTPFRGASMDPGTAFEMGYMAARGRLVLGYSNAGGGSYLERLRAAGLAAPGAATDREGLLIEDFGLPDNLMMACAVRESGAQILAQATRRLQGLQLWTDLEMFAACVEAAVRARR